MNAIYNKELKAYFSSPLGYIFIGFFLFASSLTFMVTNIQESTSNLKAFFEGLNTIQMFLIPILTMRLLSEERNSKTDQLLLTSPVSITHIVLGKLFAAISVYGLSLWLTIIFPFIISVYGEISRGELISQYIGFLLMSSAFIAIGTYISALTENQLISAVATFGILFVLFITDKVAVNVSSPSVSAFLNHISISSRYGDFSRGIINTEAIVYYLSVVCLFCFLTVHHIDKKRWM